MSDAIALWNRLLGALSASGTAVDARVTPAELGRRIALSGDDRVQRFVVEYYYPRVFGQEPGTLDDAAARSIVESMESRPPPPIAAAAPDDPCPLCGQKGA